nr:hypothetical protein [Tanacetum cinerariifolium]
MGKVKDFSSIPNLYTILTDEGFSGAKLTYMGETWVTIEFDKVDTKEHLMNHSGIKSWFLEIKDAVDEFVKKDCNSDGESAIEPLNNNDNEEEFDDEYASDVNEVPDTVFGANASSNLRSNGSVAVHQSKDPFGLYDLLNKKKAGETGKSSPSLSHPPGFTPEILEDQNDNEAKDTLESLNAKIDKDLDSGLISETIILRRLELKRKLLNINDMESKDYIQKSKVTWAIEGDKNSKFFHGIINKKRSQLAIRGIFVDGSWCTEPSSKKRGGLGVSSFFALNRALLLKWVWRFISQDGSLWSRVIRSIYGPKIDAHTTHTSSNWCAIVRELHSLKDKGFNFWSHCKKRIGNGIDTSFWYDCWIDDSAIHIEFPRLFALELDKEISVAGKMNSQVTQSFRRKPRGDRWYCDLSRDGEFRVKELWNFIDDKYLPSHTEATRWVKLVPIKVNIFVWRARRDCLPTRTNLEHRGVDLVSSKCPICHDFDEDIKHSLFRCDLAQCVLRRVCRWWNFDPQEWSSFLE